MILVGGENLMDLITQDVPGANLTLSAIEGGSPYNTALAAARLGASVGYLTPISTDSFGDRLKARLERAGAYLLGERVDGPTSLAVVSLSSGQARYQFYREGTAERQVDFEILSDSLTQGHTLHIGSLALTGERDGEVWVSLFEHAQQRGLFTSVDLNIRPQFAADETRYRDRLRRVMTSASLIKLSDEDLSWWVGRSLINPEDQRRALLAIHRSFKPQLTCLTRGAEGAWMCWGGHDRVEVIERPAHPLVDLVDTVGAGDTFMGGLLSTLDELVIGDVFFDGWTALRVQRALDLGSAAASINCEREGCQPPELSEVKARLMTTR